jgi:hypothetical protein
MKLSGGKIELTSRGIPVAGCEVGGGLFLLGLQAQRHRFREFDDTSAASEEERKWEVKQQGVHTLRIMYGVV